MTLENQWKTFSAMLEEAKKNEKAVQMLESEKLSKIKVQIMACILIILLYSYHLINKSDTLLLAAGFLFMALVVSLFWIKPTHHNFNVEAEKAQLIANLNKQLIGIYGTKINELSTNSTNEVVKQNLQNYVSEFIDDLQEDPELLALQYGSGVTPSPLNIITKYTHIYNNMITQEHKI